MILLLTCSTPRPAPFQFNSFLITYSATQVQLRVLQSSLLLVSSLQSNAMSEELLSQALLVCFALTHGAKDGAVRHAALATVRQTLSMLFDRVATVAAQASSLHYASQEALAVASQAYEAGKKKQQDSGDTSTTAEAAAAAADEGLKAAVDEEKACAAAVESAGLSGVGRCAYLVFQDLCVLSRGEQVVMLTSVFCVCHWCCCLESSLSSRCKHPPKPCFLSSSKQLLW